MILMTSVLTSSLVLEVLLLLLLFVLQAPLLLSAQATHGRPPAVWTLPPFPPHLSLTLLILRAMIVPQVLSLLLLQYHRQEACPTVPPRASQSSKVAVDGGGGTSGQL